MAKVNRKLSDIWVNSNFFKLWIGQSISAFGSQISFLALQIVAIALLHATAFQMGVVTFAELLPIPFVSLFAGLLADRFPRKPILITADIARCVVLATVPVAFLYHVLSLPQLYVVSVLVSSFNILFNVANSSWLAGLVGKENLVKANSWTQMSFSVSRVAGPGISGLLISLLGAPIAVIADSVSFVCSAVSIVLIPIPKSTKPSKPRGTWHKDIGEGMKVVFSHKTLSSITIATAFNAFFLTAQGAEFLLFLSRTLQIKSTVLGVVLSLGSIGGVVGASLATRLSRKLGTNKAIITAHVLWSASLLALPFAWDDHLASLCIVIFSNTLFGFSQVFKGIVVSSYRQSLIPSELQGRVAASLQFLTGIVLPLGPLVGGFLGKEFGLRTVLLFSGVGAVLVTVFLWNAMRLASKSNEEQAQTEVAIH